MGADLRRKFIIFSILFFLVIFAAGSFAIFWIARQTSKMDIAARLADDSKIMRNAIYEVLDHDLTLILKMAEDPALKKYIENPKNIELRNIASEEFEAYRHHLRNKAIFWVSDKDRVLHFGAKEFAVDTDTANYYWYNLTLYETEKYNLDINYDHYADETKLWVNAPVFNNRKEPIGALGTSVDMDELNKYVYSAIEQNENIFLFNSRGEIVVSKNTDFAINKTRIADRFGEDGRTLLKRVDKMHEDGVFVFENGNRIYSLTYIPRFNWYLTAYTDRVESASFNSNMALLLFVSMLFIFASFNMLAFRLSVRIDKKSRELMRQRELAQTANNAKNDLIARISRVMRTQIAAIFETSELLTARELPRKEADYAIDIKRSSLAAIGAIDNILSFSQMESGKLKTTKTEYRVSSLIHDIIDVMSAKIDGKPIRFFTNIDSNIPHILIGDDALLRQIILNLLDNAVQYTERGSISLTILQENDKADRNKIALKIEVRDTGIGVRDTSAIFDNPYDSSRESRFVEKLGLGLKITKKLCTALGGDISAESGHGRGSKFTAIIPQEIGSPSPLAKINDVKNIKVLIFEWRENCAESICWSLKNLGIQHTLIGSVEELEEIIKIENFDFLISGYGLFSKIAPTIERLKKKPQIALLVDGGAKPPETAHTRRIVVPAHTISIAELLNGDESSADIGYFQSATFIMPSAKILVAASDTASLQTIEGFLNAYRAKIDTCLSSAKAVELVLSNEYDIVLMEHNSTTLNGLETASIIRAAAAKFESLPIVVLTADAISETHEFFLSHGFSDFLAKPIKFAQLDEIMAKWIAKEKQITIDKNIEKSEKKYG
ncbi:hypothetical protein FACS189487_04020 [Campylobacterota bacterium]|nr:hypothetical protein FACS189487_04020 [Campylobacterota bacterium]